MRRALFRTLPAAMIALALLSEGRARADDDLSDLQGLLAETVVTTASKSAEEGTTAPATSSTLTAEDIRRYGIHSIDEAIDFLSLGAVTGNPLHSVDVGARGVMISRDQGDHFLLLVNGHAVNEPLLGIARFERGAGIAMEMVDHIEVILGPGSVLYGSSAMLGVVNVITKRAKDFAGTHVVVESEVAKSYRAAAGAGYEFPLFGTPSEATVMVEYYEQNGPAFTFGPQFGGNDPVTGQGFRYRRDGANPGVWGGVAKDTYNATVPSGQLRVVSGNFELNVHASTYKRATPYRSSYTNPNSDFDNPGYELDRSLWVDLRHHATLSPIVQLTTRIYGDTFDYQDVQNTSQADACLFVDTVTCTYHFKASSRWAGAEVQSSFDWMKDNTFVTLLGVDERVRMVRTKVDQINYDTQQPLTSSRGIIDTTDQTLGAYAQQTWLPTPAISFNGGARVDYENRFRGVVSPRLAASVKPWRGGTLKAIYAEAYRAPSWMETNFSYINQPRAENLKPEGVRSIEASLAQKAGANELLFGVFRSWWSDLVEAHLLTSAEADAAARKGEISELVTGNFVQYRNLSSIENYGFNAGYGGSNPAGSFRWAANFTGAIARRVDELGNKAPLVVTPQAFGNARVSYDIPGAWPTLALAGHFMSKRLADRAFVQTYVGLPYAPAQVELRATVSGEIPGVSGLSYRLGADYAFAARGAYVIGPGQPPPPVPAELVPVDQFRATIGLQYDLFRGRSETTR